jgi:hypothetical protein
MDRTSDFYSDCCRFESCSEYLFIIKNMDFDQALSAILIFVSSFVAGMILSEALDNSVPYVIVCILCVIIFIICLSIKLTRYFVL